MNKNTKLALTVGGVALAGLIVAPLLLSGGSANAANPNNVWGGGNSDPNNGTNTNEDGGWGLFDWVDDMFGGGDEQNTGNTYIDEEGNVRTEVTQLPPDYVPPTRPNYTNPDLMYRVKASCQQSHPEINPFFFTSNAVWARMEDVPASIPYECVEHFETI